MGTKKNLIDISDMAFPLFFLILEDKNLSEFTKVEEIKKSAESIHDICPNFEIKTNVINFSEGETVIECFPAITIAEKASGEDIKERVRSLLNLPRYILTRGAAIRNSESNAIISIMASGLIRDIFYKISQEIERCQKELGDDEFNDIYREVMGKEISMDAAHIAAKRFKDFRIKIMESIAEVEDIIIEREETAYKALKRRNTLISLRKAGWYQSRLLFVGDDHLDRLEKFLDRHSREIEDFYLDVKELRLALMQRLDGIINEHILVEKEIPEFETDMYCEHYTNIFTQRL